MIELNNVRYRFCENLNTIGPEALICAGSLVSHNNNIHTARHCFKSLFCVHRNYLERIFPLKTQHDYVTIRITIYFSYT